METRRRFAYRLDALAKVRAVERDALRASAAAASEEAERRSREADTLGRSVARAESALRALRSGGRALELDHELRLQSYLAAERARHEAARRRSEEALRALAAAAAELEKKQRDIKALERHKERVRGRADEGERRSEIKAADDAWLARARRK